MFSDWIDNPTVILVETTDHPIDQIPFPSVTICQKDNNPNRLNLIEKMFNFIKYPCYIDEE